MLERAFKKIGLLADGSLLVRSFDGFLCFLKRVCAGSFLVGFISAEYDADLLKRSAFARAADKILNRREKLLAPPEYFPKRLSASLANSFFISGSCAALGVPVPPPFPERKSFFNNLTSVARWLAYASPVLGVAAVTALAPFLPTMLLAGLLAAVTAVMFFTRRFAIDLTALYVLLFIFVSIFSGLTSFTPASSLPIALLTSLFMFSFFIVAACCEKRKQIEALCFVFVAASAGAGVYGIYQFVFRRQVEVSWVDVEMFGDLMFRVSSTLGNPNVYGVYLLLAIPLCASMFFYAGKPLIKFILLGVGGLLVLNLLLSYSRGCYLALAVAALVFILLTEKRLVALAPFAAAGALFALPPTMINRLLSIANTADSSTAYRLSIWRGSLRIIKDFWLTGLGQGDAAFNTVFPIYAFNAVIAPHSHNVFLQTCIEKGLVGLLVFVAMLACFIRTMVCCHRNAKEKRDKIFAAAMVAGAAGFLFQGFFDHVFYNYRVMLIFFIFMGIGCAFANIVKKENSAAQ